MEQLVRYTRTNNGEHEVMFRCIFCGSGNQGGFDNGFVTVLPYPHAVHCPTRKPEPEPEPEPEPNGGHECE